VVQSVTATNLRAGLKLAIAWFVSPARPIGNTILEGDAPRFCVAQRLTLLNGSVAVQPYIMAVHARPSQVLVASFLGTPLDVEVEVVVLAVTVFLVVIILGLAIARMVSPSTAIVDPKLEGNAIRIYVAPICALTYSSHTPLLNVGPVHARAWIVIITCN